jgi:formylglycine-generating enzyme required for sulfatase activity
METPSKASSLRSLPADADAMIRIPHDPHRNALLGVDVAEFLIDPCPVTIGQYEQYLDATGARAPRSWSQRGRPAPAQRNHPITDVSWLDAAAYCAWLGKRLPTVIEWEVAACGPARRKYPWGDAWAPGPCNTVESGLAATTPVDRYPKGASPYGVFDMVGNIWEWTSTEARSRVIGRAGTQRALKGGSFRETRETAHCRAQIQRWPEDVADDVGFRCAW